MRLDPAILADLAVAFTPKSYVRVTPLAHAATPLGAGYRVSRFASPTKAFKVIYLGQDLTTSVAETIVRDRLQGKAQRRLMGRPFGCRSSAPKGPGERPASEGLIRSGTWIAARIRTLR